MSARLGSLSLASLLLWACSTGSPPQSAADAADGSADEAQSGAEPAPEHAGKAGADAREKQAGRPYQHQAAESSAASAFRLKLAASQAFLDAPLPAPARPYRTWRQRRRIWVGHSHLQHAVLLAGEQLAAVISESEGDLRVYDLSSGKLVAQHDLTLGDYGTGDLLAWPTTDTAEPRVLLGSERGLEVIDALSGELVARPLVGSVPLMKWSPDGSILMVRAGSGELHFFRRAPAHLASASGAAESGDDASSSSARLEHLGKLDFAGRLDTFDLSRDNRLLATAFYPNEETVVWDLHTGKEVLRVRSPDFIGDLALSPDGRMLAVGGRGLLLVDLLNPDRKAFYSHFGNNVGFVTFSPSGDAVLTSSYDARIRIFSAALEPEPELSLLQTLRHDGQANVYDLRFTSDGKNLVSVSGDQTLRVFSSAIGGAGSAKGSGSTHFRTLAQWRESVPDSELERRKPPEPSLANGHYFPPQLNEPARPSRVRPGKYACRVSLMYKLRDCTVRKLDTGHTILRFHDGNLLELEGVLYDDGPVVRYEAWLNDSGVASCPGCEKQPMHGVLRGGGNTFRGLITFRAYYDPFRPPEPPPAQVKIEEADDRFPLVLQYRGPLPQSATPPSAEGR